MAIGRCQEVAETMARISMDALRTGCHLIEHYDAKEAQAVRETEKEADQYEDMLGTIWSNWAGKTSVNATIGKCPNCCTSSGT